MSKKEGLIAYVSIPKDMTAVKTTVQFNLTKRQLVCFGSGAAIGVPLFFILKPHMSVSAAAIVMVIVMLPWFLLAMYPENRPIHPLTSPETTGILIIMICIRIKYLLLSLPA